MWRFPVLGPILSPGIFHLWRLDARRKYRWVEDWLVPDQPIIDIGSGPGSVLDVFRQQGLTITGLDIRDTSFRPELSPQLYKGGRMPFADGDFHTALLLTMLHHTSDPDAILCEAKRIARRLIIIEDVYDTKFQRRYTQLADKVTNLQFFNHPHTNRSHKEWLETFRTLELTIRHAKVHRLGGIFQQAVYVVEPSRNNNVETT